MKKKRHAEKDTVARRRAGIQASKREGKRRFASFFSPTYRLEGAGKALRRGKTTQQTRQAGQRGSLKRARLNLVMWSPKETWKNRYERLTFHSPFFEGVNSPRSPEKQSPGKVGFVSRPAKRSYKIPPSGGYISLLAPTIYRTCCIFFPFSFSGTHANPDK